MRLSLFIALGLLASVACQPAQVSPTPAPTALFMTPVAGSEIGTGIYRWHDDELGVMCWIYNGVMEGGVSCIPDDQISEVSR